MSLPSSRNLSHDYPAWKGLSLRELFWIVITTTPLTAFFCTLTGIMLGFPLACGCVGFLLGFILAITFWPKRISRVKEGKPYGYVTKKTIQLLVKLKVKHSPWFHYEGKWRKNKTLGEPYV